MATQDPAISFNNQYKDSALQKMNTMRRLVDAMGEDGMIHLSSLVPLSAIIDAIVMKDRTTYEVAMEDLGLIIDEKKNGLSLDNLAEIAVINFLEGFESFICFIYQGKQQPQPPSEKERDGRVRRAQSEVNTQSPQSSIVSDSPMIKAKSASHHASKRAYKKKDTPVPAKKRQSETVVTLDDEEEEKEEEEEVEVEEMEIDEEMIQEATVDVTETPIKPVSKPVSRRKSARRPIYENSTFECLFDQCKEVFASAKELAEHAEKCSHAEGYVLLFKCSQCRRSFKTDKAVKAHIGHAMNHNKCDVAKIEIESVEESLVASALSSTSSTLVTPSRARSLPRFPLSLKGGNIQSGGGKAENTKDNSLTMECSLGGCTFRSVNPYSIYTHVKSAHPTHNTLFRCDECGMERVSGKAMADHRTKMCPGTSIEVIIHKKGEIISKAETPLPIQENWENALRECPVKGCQFSSVAAKYVQIHVKKAHKEYSMLYECSECDYVVDQLALMTIHCKSCQNSRPWAIVELQKRPLTRSKSVPRMTTATSSRIGQKTRGKTPSQRVVKTEGTNGQIGSEGAEMPMLEDMVNQGGMDDVVETGHHMKTPKKEVMDSKEEEADEVIDVVGEDEEKKKKNREADEAYEFPSDVELEGDDDDDDEEL